MSNVKEHASNAQACSCTGVRCLGMGDYKFVCVNITSEKINLLIINLKFVDYCDNVTNIKQTCVVVVCVDEEACE